MPIYIQNTSERLILASSSPRRRELLSECGLTFEVLPSHADEQIEPGETPREMVERLALLKGREISGRFPDAWVIAADTTVTIDGAILGKPENAEDAVSMLSRIQGRWHEVWSAFALLNRSRSVELCEATCTRVRMTALDQEQIRRYVSTGEPMDKAGSYAIQEQGVQLVDEVSGSYTTVVGLNVPALVRALRAHQVIR